MVPPPTSAKLTAQLTHTITAASNLHTILNSFPLLATRPEYTNGLYHSPPLSYSTLLPGEAGDGLPSSLAASHSL